MLSLRGMLRDASARVTTRWAEKDGLHSEVESMHSISLIIYYLCFPNYIR